MMELRQLRYLIRTIEFGSISRAAADLQVVPSALSQQIRRLESELSAQLLQRGPRGILPTEAGAAFFREAQLTLRHADQARRVAGEARLSGSVSIGLAPTTAAVLAIPLLRDMRARYPEVRLHIVESLSGHLSAMLNARQLDLAVLFSTQPGTRWSVAPLLEEKLLFISARKDGDARTAGAAPISIRALAQHELVMPTGNHGLRSTLDAAFLRSRVSMKLAAEIDSLAVLMDAVDSGLGATVQPGAALGRYADVPARFRIAPLADRQVHRLNVVCSLSDAELSPAALAARIVLSDTARALVTSKTWPGATIVSA